MHPNSDKEHLHGLASKNVRIVFTVVPMVISLLKSSILLYILIMRHLFWTLCRVLICLGATVHQTGAAHFTIGVSEFLCTVTVILVPNPKIKFILLCHWPVFYESSLRQTAYFIWGIAFPPIWLRNTWSHFFAVRYGRIILSYVALNDFCSKFQS